MNSYPLELVNSFSRGSGEVVLFVGAGFSINAGLVDWVGLVKPLSERMNLHFPENSRDINVEHLLTVIQYYENQYGRQSLIQYLRDKLNVNLPPSKAHHLITLLPVNLLFTTNYDNLIEKAYEMAGRKTNVVALESEIPYFTSDSIQIYKICGDLAYPKSISVSKRDFSTFTETHKEMVNNLRTIISTKTVLFLGYSIRDPFLNFVWDSIRLAFGDNQKIGYALFFEIDDLEVDDLWRRGVKVLKISKTGKSTTDALNEWLEELARKTS